jgi:hypothetical protein
MEKSPKIHPSDQNADYAVLKRNLSGHGVGPGLPQIRFLSTTLGKKQKKLCILCAKNDREMYLSQ